MGSLGFIICKLLEYNSVVPCVSRVMEKLDLRRIRPPHIIVLRRRSTSSENLRTTIPSIPHIHISKAWHADLRLCTCGVRGYISHEMYLKKGGTSAELRITCFSRKIKAETRNLLSVRCCSRSRSVALVFWLWQSRAHDRGREHRKR